MANDLSFEHVGSALHNLGNFRVLAAQRLAQEGPPDLVSGALLLSLGLRESDLNNIENQAQTDKGCFQITSIWHAEWLGRQPGCKSGQWRAEGGHSALEKGYVPRFTPASVFALDMLSEAINYGSSRHGLKEGALVRFAVAAYNAGIGGANAGLKAGDVDLKTTGGDYSAWVIRHRSLVQRWLREHPNWHV